MNNKSKVDNVCCWPYKEHIRKEKFDLFKAQKCTWLKKCSPNGLP